MYLHLFPCVSMLLGAGGDGGWILEEFDWGWKAIKIIWGINDDIIDPGVVEGLPESNG